MMKAFGSYDFSEHPGILLIVFGSLLIIFLARRYGRRARSRRKDSPPDKKNWL